MDEACETTTDCRRRSCSSSSVTGGYCETGTGARHSWLQKRTERRTCSSVSLARRLQLAAAQSARLTPGCLEIASPVGPRKPSVIAPTAAVGTEGRATGATPRAATSSVTTGVTSTARRARRPPPRRPTIPRKDVLSLAVMSQEGLRASHLGGHAEVIAVGDIPTALPLGAVLLGTT